jgi:immune inhibitor A
MSSTQTQCCEPGIDAPTACMAHPDVVKNIREVIRDGGILSVADARLAREAGLLSITPIERPGMNDGVIYPPHDLNGPALSGMPARMRPGRKLARQKPSGALHCLVLLVDFSDNIGTAPPSHYDALLFDSANPDSMHSFYKDISNGKLNVTGTVTEWIRAPQSYAYYTAGASGTGSNHPHNTPGLLQDILTLYCAGNSLAPFDQNGDGFVDGLFLVHAGSGAESEADPAKRPDLIWSHKWTLKQPFSNSGVQAFAYFTAPEDGRLGVFSHEFGHFLGLPDLYDTSYRSRGIGDWCLMAGGSWNGGGNQPARMSAWCLAELGWINPIDVKGTINVTLDTLEKDPKACYRLYDKGKKSGEYFLVENRQRAGRDIGLPGNGLALWHIDDSQSDNTNPWSYRVGLVQADGKRDLELNRNDGDPGDLFPGSAKVVSVQSAAPVQPNTFLNNGLPSSVKVAAITEKNGIVSAVLSA